MATPHTTESHFTNPEVAYERTDVAARPVVIFAAALTAVILATVGLMSWMFWSIQSLEDPQKTTDLPTAQSAREAGLPPIPLEGIEDIGEGRPRLFPPRGAEYTAPRERQLRQGDAKQGVLPIEQAMAQFAADVQKKDESSKRQVEKAPSSFSIRLPSKAASGWRDTGGQ